jgi:uncharacterized protein (TIGR01777 family)
VLVSGATGFLGHALRPALEARGLRVVALTRSPDAGPDAIVWDPALGRLDLAGAPPFDAVIHLAGATVAGRWSDAQRRRIRESRVQGTRVLCEALARLERRPRRMISASAMGWYGDRGDEPLTESSPPGRGFLAEVAQAWEQAADPARAAGIRVVHPRIGLVLSKHGGALAPMLLPFRLGLGGTLGDGRQWWSWIALADVVKAFLAFLDDDRFEGPVNLASPEPVSQAGFARQLGRALHRPAWFPAPAFALRLLLDGFADEGLLASARLVPETLLAAGYRFEHADLSAFLHQELA